MVTAALHNPKSTLAGNRAVETSLTFDASGGSSSPALLVDDHLPCVQRRMFRCNAHISGLPVVRACTMGEKDSES